MYALLKIRQPNFRLVGLNKKQQEKKEFHDLSLAPVRGFGFEVLTAERRKNVAANGRGLVRRERKPLQDERLISDCTVVECAQFFLRFSQHTQDAIAQNGRTARIG